MSNRYLEIIAVPLNQDNNESFPLLSIIGTVERNREIRVMVSFFKIDSRIRCFLGFDGEDGERLAITKDILSGLGYVIREVGQLDFFLTLHSRTVVQRRVINERLHGIDDTYSSHYRASVVNGCFRSNAIVSLLETTNDNSGIVILYSNLTNRVQNQIMQNIAATHMSWYDEDGRIENGNGLVESDVLFQMSVFLCGSDEEQRLLGNVMSYSIPGMSCYSITEQDIVGLFGNGEKKFGDIVRGVLPDFRIIPVLFSFSEHEIKRLIGINGAIEKMLPPNLDTFWEQKADPYFHRTERSIKIGQSLYGSGCYWLGKRELRESALIVGSTGSGKGNLLFSIIKELKSENLLIFEAAKKEIHHLRSQNNVGEIVLPNLQTWRPNPGEFLFNPFEIPNELSLGEYRASLVQMMKTCFRLDGPLEELFTATLNRCFAKAGYVDSSHGGDREVKRWGLHEFIVEYCRMIRESGYSEKTKEDMRTAGVYRLERLLGISPDVFDTVRSIDITELTRGQNLIQLNSLPTVESKQLIATMILIALGAYMAIKYKHSENPDTLRLVIILDEAHNLLRAVDNVNGESFSFSEDFANLMLTLRSVGVGFIISDQTTRNIPRTISEACNTKIFLGNSRFSGIEEYLDYLGADENLLKQLYRLDKGEGMLVTNKAPHAVFFRTDNYIDLFPLSTEGSVHNSLKDTHESQKVAVFSECNLCPWQGTDKCCMSVKMNARMISNGLVARYGNPLRWKYNPIKGIDVFKTGDIHSQVHTVCVALKKKSESLGLVKLDYCTTIQWARACNMEYGDWFSEKKIQWIIKEFGN